MFLGEAGRGPVMRHLWIVGVVGLALLSTAPGCSGCGTPGVSVDPVPTGGTTADHEVRCGCQLGWDSISCSLAGSQGIPADLCSPNPRSFNLDMCVPADLNTALDAPGISQHDFDQGIRDFCEQRATQALEAFLGKVSGDNACGHFHLTCEPVAIDSSGAAVAMNPQCDKRCADIPCVTDPDGGTVNCHLDRFIEADGGVDTTACSCTNTTGCGQTTSGVCQPLDVVSDPPTVRTGLLSFALATPTRLRIDPGASQVTVKAQVQGCLGSLCAGFSDTETSPVHGTLTLYGKPCPHGTCSLRLGLVAHPDDVTFSRRYACASTTPTGPSHSRVA